MEYSKDNAMAIKIFDDDPAPKKPSTASIFEEQGITTPDQGVGSDNLKIVFSDTVSPEEKTPVQTEGSSPFLGSFGGTPAGTGTNTLPGPGSTGTGTLPDTGTTGTPLPVPGVVHPVGVPAASKPVKFFDESQSVENKLNEQTVNEISNEVIDTINREFSLSLLQHPTKEERKQVAERIGVLVTRASRGRSLTPGATYENNLSSELARRLMGLGFLDLLLPPTRNDISEIGVYSSGLVQIIRKEHVEWETVDAHPSAEEIQRVLDRILGPQNKNLNETNPSVNAKLPRTEDIPGGARVKALHKCIAPPGRNAVINIRLYDGKPVLPEWLLARKEFSPEMMDTLRAATEYGCKILITGSTGTGKTTLLSALCNFLQPHWRIVKIEETEEIWIARDTVQSIESRPQTFGTEVLPYTLANGVDDAMRMTPDYLIVGEVRDGIAGLALFRALMTGHSGSCTLHANSPREAAKRMAVLLGADAHVSKVDANQMFADSLDLHIQIKVRHGRRIITSISQVRKTLKAGDVWFDPLWLYEESSTKNDPQWRKVGDLDLNEELADELFGQAVPKAETSSIAKAEKEGI